MIDWSRVKYFRRQEFDSPDQPGSGDYMNEATLGRLCALRELVGLPMVINSGFRTKTRNASEGGAKRSAHLFGRAVDIRWMGWSQKDKEKIVRIARQLGFTGFGIAHSFIHLDDMTEGDGYVRPSRWEYGPGGHAGHATKIT